MIKMSFDPSMLPCSGIIWHFFLWQNDCSTMVLPEIGVNLPLSALNLPLLLGEVLSIYSTCPSVVGLPEFYCLRVFSYVCVYSVLQACCKRCFCSGSMALFFLDLLLWLYLDVEFHQWLIGNGFSLVSAWFQSSFLFHRLIFRQSYSQCSSPWIPTLWWGEDIKVIR